jgi:hypothetical protein
MSTAHAAGHSRGRRGMAKLDVYGHFWAAVPSPSTLSSWRLCAAALRSGRAG